MHDRYVASRSRTYRGLTVTISRFLKRGLPGLVVMASVMLFSAHPLEAQIKDGTGGLEINAFYGMLNGLGDTEFENDPVPWRLDNDPYFGGRLGYVFDIGVGIEGFFGYVDSKIIGSAYDGTKTKVMNYGGDITYNFNIHRSIQLAVMGGAGMQSFDLDIDALDPSNAPGTGTPEVGGFTSYQILQLVRGLRGLNTVGFDLVEVSPPYDSPGDITSILAANLAFEFLSLLALQRLGSREAGKIEK